MTNVNNIAQFRILDKDQTDKIEQFYAQTRNYWDTLRIFQSDCMQYMEHSRAEHDFKYLHGTYIFYAAN